MKVYAADKREGERRDCLRPLIFMTKTIFLMISEILSYHDFDP